MANYKVQKGDTLSAIARSEGVDLFDLVAANRGIDPNLIRPGQVIRLPTHEYSASQRSQAAVDIAATDPTGRFSATGVPGGGLGGGTPTPGLTPQITSPLLAPTIATPPIGYSYPGGVPVYTPPPGIGLAGISGAGLAQYRASERGQVPQTQQTQLSEQAARQIAARTAGLTPGGRVPFGQPRPATTPTISRGGPGRRADQPIPTLGGGRLPQGQTPEQLRDERLYREFRERGPGSFLAYEWLRGRPAAIGDWWVEGQVIPSLIRKLTFEGRSQSYIDEQVAAVRASRNEVQGPGPTDVQPNLFGRGANPEFRFQPAVGDQPVEVTPPVASREIRTSPNYARAIGPFSSPDVIQLRRQNWDANIGIAAAGLMSDAIRTDENVLVYADAMKFIADAINGNPAAIPILETMTEEQILQFAEFMAANPKLAERYVKAVDGKTREQIIEIARKELMGLGYSQYPTSNSLYRSSDYGADSRAGNIEDLVFGGGVGGGGGRGGGGDRGDGDGGGGGGGGGGRIGNGPVAPSFVVGGAGLYMWRINL